MKSKELMIDDWVSYKNKMPCKITAICKDTAVVDNDTTQDWRIDYNKLTPISLTAEILSKNGYTRNTFEYNTTKIEEWVSEDGRITMRDSAVIANSNNKWSVHVDNEDMQSIGYFEITYVHELQHALRLVGVEKEIEL